MEQSDRVLFTLDDDTLSALATTLVACGRDNEAADLYAIMLIRSAEELGVTEDNI